ncbi:protein JASON [Trifolium repens]|nr:protein JASON [Trifolium repens]
MLRFLKRGLAFLLRFFFRSVKAAMRCFFGFRDNNRRHPPPPLLINAPSRSTTDVLISRNRLSSLLSKEEKNDSAQNVDVGSQEYDQGIKDEVKFLKACGTIAGTPAEIRKTSAKLKVSPVCDRGSDTSKFHSWLPNASVEKLHLDVQPSDPPTPIKLCQELGNSTDSFEQTPSSYVFKARDAQHDSPDYVEGSWTRSTRTAYKTRKNEASVTPWPVTDTQKKTKSVRFECENDLVSYQSPPDDWHMKKNKSPDSQSTCKRSPYPTPLKLFDDMQTPGTVYPASLEDLCDGKHHVRSQFVYPNYNLGENVLLSKLLEVQDFNPEQDSSELGDSVEGDQNPTPTSGKSLKKIESETESNMEASLCSWLKPASIIIEEGNEEIETADCEILQSADRSIIGVVHAQLNEVNDSRIVPPKWRNGNGIPNSTKKYKEDQTVKWHATPFEERLDKALSEDNFISQRKLAIAKPVSFEEIEE